MKHILPTLTTIGFIGLISLVISQLPHQFGASRPPVGGQSSLFAQSPIGTPRQARLELPSGLTPAPAASQSAPAPSQPDSTAGQPAAAAPSETNGTAMTAADAERLFRRAVERTAQWTAVEAKTRQRVQLFGHDLLGAGHYWQLGAGEGSRFRFELKFNVGEHVSTFVNVCDGDHLWLRKDLPSQRTLSVVDLSRLRQAMVESPVAAGNGAMNPWFLLGGIPRLMNGLMDNFQFQRGTSTQLGQAPVWRIEGDWRPEKLANIVPAHKEQIAAGNVDWQGMPEPLPSKIVVYLSRDPAFELFPHRVDFQRTVRAGDKVHEKALTILEFYEVQLPHQLDPRMFRYVVQNQHITDATDEFIKSLGLQTSE